LGGARQNVAFGVSHEDHESNNHKRQVSHCHDGELLHMAGDACTAVSYTNCESRRVRRDEEDVDASMWLASMQCVEDGKK
jgi:hypothetical protein